MELGPRVGGQKNKVGGQKKQVVQWSYNSVRTSVKPIYFRPFIGGPQAPFRTDITGRGGSFVARKNQHLPLKFQICSKVSGVFGKVSSFLYWMRKTPCRRVAVGPVGPEGSRVFMVVFSLVNWILGK